MVKNVRFIKVRQHGRVKELRYTDNGKQKSIYAKTVKECRIKASKIQVQSKKKIVERSYTFIQWYEKWLHLYKKDVLKSETYKNLVSLFNKYILPYLANKKIKQITSEDIQKIVNGVKDYPRQQTICYTQLNACLNQAFKLNIISYNPCIAVVIKKHKGNKGKALTKDQQQELLNYIENHYNEVNNLVLIYLNTGMRCSELLNLKQTDVDRNKNEIHKRGKKTISSDRILQTNKQVVDLIPFSPFPFLNWNKSKVEREFKKITSALHFDKITIHSLRHTFATRCIENGVDMVVLQKWLGHSSITMTIDRYTHISEEYKKQQQSKIKYNF